MVPRAVMSWQGEEHFNEATVELLAPDEVPVTSISMEAVRYMSSATRIVDLTVYIRNDKFAGELSTLGCRRCIALYE